MPVCLNHLNLVVSDPDAAEGFFTTYFAFTVRTRHRALIVLDGADGFVLVLMRARESAPAYPAGFHVGFLVDDEAAVDAEYARPSRPAACAAPTASTSPRSTRSSSRSPPDSAGRARTPAPVGSASCPPSRDHSWRR
jgi:hypothetical protein